MFLIPNLLWGEKITDYTQLVSGQQYYIGATVSSDYYFSVASENVGTSIQGSAVTDKTQATKVTAIGSGASWAFQLSSGNYLSLKNGKDNGKVAVVNTEAKWTLSNKSSLVNMMINGYCLQRNSSASTNFGSYKSGQKDVWFELAPAEKPFTVTLQDNGVKHSELTESKVGAGVELPTLSSPCTDWSFVGWAETAIAETTIRPTIIEAGTYKPTKDITLYAVYSKTVENGNGATDVVFDVATIASENKWANGTAYLSYTIDPITITYSGGGNNGKYYSSDKSWRIYADGTITITSQGATITKVQTNSSNTFTKQTDGSWVLSNKKASFTEFIVSYSGGSTTTYASSPVCGSAQQATITFDLNGGTGTTPASITDEEGKKITLPAANGITKDGYTFAGWNTTTDGTGTDYVAGAEYIIPAGGATLYAKWQQVQQEAEPPYTVMLIADPTNSGVVAFDEGGKDTKDFSAAGVIADITATPNVHFRFAKWTVFDGDAEVADPNSNKTTITVKKVKETMLAANFVPLYTITTSATNGKLTLTNNTTKAGDITEAAENDVLEIALSVSEGYVLKSLTVNGKALAATDGKYTFTMPAAEVSIVATIEQAKTWYLVYDMATLNAGDQVVFAYADESHVAGDLSGDYLAAITATFGADKTTITSLPDNANVFTLGGTEGAYTFANVSNMLLMSSSKGKMSFGTTANTWDVQIEDGIAEVKNVTYNTYSLQYNYNNGTKPRFKTYNSKQSDIQIFTDHKLIQKATAHWYADAAHSKELTEAYAKQSTGFVAYFVTNSDGAKTFRSSNSAVATIDADGVITIVGEGATTISCTTESTSDYLTNSASFVLNVLPENTCIWFATDINSTSNTEVGVVLEEPIKLEFANNSGANAPIFHAKDGTVRFYKSNTLTISGENKLITDIKIVFATGNVGTGWTAAAGTYAVSGVEGIWEGLAPEVILTNPNNRSDILSIEVHYLNSEVVRTGLAAGQHGTICLEKNVTAMLGASFYEIAYREDKDGTPYRVCFDEVSALEAGVPYIFLAEDEQITVVYGDETASAAKSKNGLVGTFDDIEDRAAGTAGNQLEGNYLINGNMIRLCGGNCSLSANRAYIYMDDVPTDVVAPAPGRRRITMQNADAQVTTGLNGISEDTPIAPQQQGIYDVLGRKLEQTAGTGFYIVNGKKQVIVR